MRKGGYEIINLNDLPLSTSETSTSVDLYEKLLKSKKVVLLSSLKIDDKTFNDCFMFVDKKTDEITLKNSAYIITVEDDGTITTVENTVVIPEITYETIYDLLKKGTNINITKDDENEKVEISIDFPIDAVDVNTLVNGSPTTVQGAFDYLYNYVENVPLGHIYRHLMQLTDSSDQQTDYYLYVYNKGQTAFDYRNLTQELEDCLCYYIAKKTGSSSGYSYFQCTVKRVGAGTYNFVLLDGTITTLSSHSFTTDTVSTLI